jgi:hypothetical protein
LYVLSKGAIKVSASDAKEWKEARAKLSVACKLADA